MNCTSDGDGWGPCFCVKCVAEELKRENERLREENARLKKQRRR